MGTIDCLDFTLLKLAKIFTRKGALQICKGHMAHALKYKENFKSRTKTVASHFSITVKAQRKYKKTVAFNIAINSELNFELNKSSNYRNPKILIISLNYCTLLFYYHNFFLIVTLFKHYQTIFILNLFLIYRT